MKGVQILYWWMPILAASLLSCYAPRYVYGPPAQNVPVFTQKGDAKLAAFYATNLSGKTSLEEGSSRTSRNRGMDVQAAYALSNHLAVQANYMQRTERNFADVNISRNDTSTIYYKRNLAELGIGYFNVSNRDRVIFQVYGGAGVGSSSFEDIYSNGEVAAFNKYLHMNVLRFFIQPSFTVKYQNFATAISSRFSMLSFRNIRTNYTAGEMKVYRLATLGTQNEVFWEPGLINTFGFANLPGVQVELQLGMSFLMSDHPVDYRVVNFSAGLLFDVPRLLKGND